MEKAQQKLDFFDSLSVPADITAGTETVLRAPAFPGGALNVGDGQVLAGPTEPRRMTSGWSFRQLM